MYDWSNWILIEESYYSMSNCIGELWTATLHLVLLVFHWYISIMTQPRVENRRSGNDIAIIVMSWIVLSLHILGNFEKFVMSNWSNWHELYRSDWKTVIGILSSRPWDFCLLIYRQFLNKWIMSYLFFIGGMNSFFSLKRYEFNRSITLWAMKLVR